MESKKIMVIAGSKWQIPITKKIIQMGHRPFVVNLYENSPAFAFAEQFGVMDILDKEACLSFAREHKVDAVLSEECDIAMPTVAYVAEKMGLPSLGQKSAALYTNKFMMREFCFSHGLAFPEYQKCRDIDEALAFFRKIKRKIIIKPLDSNSSRGVFVINTQDELKKHFNEALSYSKAEKCVLAERYIEGTEFTVDGIKTPEKHFTLAISEKKHYVHNPSVACELFFSHQNEKYDYKELKRVSDAFINKSGLEFGLTHAEYKYEDGKFYLIEIAARGGGNLISSNIVPILSGIDNYKYLVNCSLGKIESNDFTPDSSRIETCAVLKFFDTPAGGGVVSQIDGIDFLKNSKNIDTFELNFEVGSKIEPAADDSKRIGFYIARGENKEQLQSLMAEIDETFHIHLESWCS